IRSVSCGDEHTLLITEGYQLYAMGSNADGRLGLSDPSLKDTRTPLLVKDLAHLRICAASSGGAHSVALSSEGQAFAWGKGESGALGLGAMENEWGPQLMKLAASMRVRQVSCGSRHTALLAITSDSKGTLLTCGSGDFGQLGTGLRTVLLPTLVTTDGEVKQVSCGVVHTAFTSYTGKVYAMGGNNLGQLGTGNKVSAKGPGRVRTLEGVFIEKVVCGNHTAALSDKGELYIWGTGPFGEKLLPWRISTPVPLRDLDIGGCFGAAIDLSKHVWTWGTNASGELGQGDFKQRKAPTLVPSLGKKSVRSIACGSNFVVALGGEVRSKQGKPPLRDQSPFARYNLPLVRSRPFSEITTPRSTKEFLLESPALQKLVPARSPSEFLFSPRKDPETIPETSEFDQSDDLRPRPATNLHIRSEDMPVKASITPEERKTEVHPQGEKATDELAALRAKLQTAENSITALNGKISYLEKEGERVRGENRELEVRLRGDVERLEEKVRGKEEEVAVAGTARMQMQAAYDKISESNQQLLQNLHEEKAAKSALLVHMQALEAENQRLQQELQHFSVSKDSYPASIRTRESGCSRPTPGQHTTANGGQKSALPQLNLDLLNRAKSRKERTIRLLNSVTPPDSQSRHSSQDDDLNMRYDDLDESPDLSAAHSHFREFSQSAASLSDMVTQDRPNPTKGSSPIQPRTPDVPLTERKPINEKEREAKNRLRSNVTDLKYKLKALKDNQPALESKISAFERRLRGTMDRKP
ncbi:MAG TPA: hypothetical protein DCS88_11065, partial [Alphaproteobacteria bacterium]|nr:hypothetical protein [Alphaproteobacteria bacterium]